MAHSAKVQRQKHVAQGREGIFLFHQHFYRDPITKFMLLILCNCTETVPKIFNTTTTQKMFMNSTPYLQ